jgi:pimeloyl-ACP methyl ester carboxylesterase
LGNEQLVNAAMIETTHYCISADGTKIGYRQIGKGKGLIILHGAGRISQNYRGLAIALADRYTVYFPDRRGRGLSGVPGPGYGINKATEDLLAVIDATGADFIFGHSVGALVALETMRSHALKKIAVYEPAISVNHSLPCHWLDPFEKAINQQQFKNAMAISLKGLNVFEGINAVPMWCVRLLVGFISILEKKKEKGTRMLDLLPTLAADVKMVMQLDSTVEHYQTLSIPVLLMAGSKSPAYFHTGLKALEQVLPLSSFQLFGGFDHYSPEEKTQQIAAALNNFFQN